MAILPAPLSGTVNWTGGTVNSGTSLTLATNGVLNIVGNVTLAGPLTNYGPVNWQSGTVTVYNYVPGGYTGAIWNQAGALWNIQCDEALNYETSAGTNFFNNAGLVRKSAGTNTTTFNLGHPQQRHRGRAERTRLILATAAAWAELFRPRPVRSLILAAARTRSLPG